MAPARDAGSRRTGVAYEGFLCQRRNSTVGRAALVADRAVKDRREAGMILGLVTAVLLLAMVALVVVLIRGPRTPAGSPPDRPAEPLRPPPHPAPAQEPEPAPTTIGSGNARITVDVAGLTVELRGHGFATSWHRHRSVTWPQVISLQLDTGTLDSPLSLYATVAGARFREHLVDGGALSRAEWAVLDRRITACTNGRIRLDLRLLDQNRPPERF